MKTSEKVNDTFEINFKKSYLHVSHFRYFSREKKYSEEESNPKPLDYWRYFSTTEPTQRSSKSTLLEGGAPIPFIKSSTSLMRTCTSLRLLGTAGDCVKAQFAITIGYSCLTAEGLGTV